MRTSPESGVRGPESFKKLRSLWLLRVLCATKDSTQSTQRVSVASVLNLFPRRRTRRGQSWLCFGSAALLVGLMFMPGCGGGSTTTTTTTTTPPPPVANSVTVTVNAGPANNAVNMAYVSVQVCTPGATTNCVTIPYVQLDTASSGLRILASFPGVSGLNLNQVTDPSKHPVYECYEFADGNYLWGPVMQGGVAMAGESATNVPMQLIEGSAPSNTPCGSTGGSNLTTSTALQANGILGIGPAMQDCGLLCYGTTVQPLYWVCPSGSACSLASVPTATQVSNPVAFFNSTDTNGVMLTMGSVVSSGASQATGTLYFGIGTQTDNALSSSAKAYALSSDPLNPIPYYPIFATYNSTSYAASIDSAQQYLVILDPTTLAGAGITSCASSQSTYYCPSSAVTLPLTIKDNNGDTATLSPALSIGNATTLLASSVLGTGTNTAFSNLAEESVPGTDYVILGMPFFYGRTVYVGIAGQAPPSGLSATTYGALGYWAF